MDINLKSIDGIVFDMDGIIFDTEAIGMRCWLAMGEKYGLQQVRETALKCIGRSLVDTMKIFEDAYGSIVNIEQLYHESKVMFGEIIDEEGIPLKTGARELLEYLRKNNVTVGLASSTSYSLVCQQLKRADLFKFFRVIVGGDMISHSKPQPDIYLLACERLGINPQKTIAVEDSRNGIISAHAAGMITFHIPDLVEIDEQTKALYFKKFDDLTQVRDYLIESSNAVK